MRNQKLYFISKFKETIRFRLYNPAIYLVDITRAKITNFFSQNYSSNVNFAPIKILLISDNKSYTNEQQFSPFFDYRKELQQKFCLVFNHMLIGDVLNLPAVFISNYDLIFVKLAFWTPADKAEKIIQQIYNVKGNTKLVYFDGDDDLCIQWPNILPYLDLYVKRQIFNNFSQYQTIFTGKTNLTDYVARTWNISFAKNIIPYSQPVDPTYFDKIFLGWTFGLDDKIRNLYYKYNLESQQIMKDNDIICRATVPDDWMYYLRKDITPKLQKMAAKCKVITPDERVTQEEYYQELRRSKICVSPFGYGEICYRDFEAVLCKCLLVKPDMSHIKTEPDIFVPNITYIPIKWDFSDLEEKCFYYLENNEEREKIVEQAYNVLSEYYTNKWFLFWIDKMLKKLSLK